MRRDQMLLPAVRVLSNGGSSSGMQGSGFVIGRKDDKVYVLTNHHVIKDSIQTEDRWDPIDKSSKKVERRLPVIVESFRYDERGVQTQSLSTAADIVAYQAFGDKFGFEGDLALLRLRAPLEGVPAARLIGKEAFLDEVRVFDDVVMVGTPEKCDTPLPSKGHIASLTEERGSVALMLSQLFGNQGASGSAVYRYSIERDAYEIVAVHCMVDFRGSLTDAGRGSYLRLAVPAPQVHDFLKGCGYEAFAAAAAAPASAAADTGGKAAAAAAEPEEKKEEERTPKQQGKEEEEEDKSED